MGIKYTMRWMVNKMWPRIEGGTSYSAQKAKYEGDSSRSSSSSQYDGASTLHDSEADFFGIDASKIKLLNMVLRVN
ncbi:hypothetical protein H4R99_007468 [Coemansia sp. RSA 1722]|nr:hypothetical protein LPJ57_003567 [Coemansia sp. RSA 486]KAJ2221646.1 hypothetical protein IWW45_008817 [Coemansia sp. RSA 485]KAJ2589426.1 hypothetical protein H4R99_007468 [Coemansia sp. RSA 1722]KAJ2602009.1 hypothetical protein GGF39_000956 [Coemansia sp. RSA 1721]KAJ2703573.1 hypothetical protein FB645_003842 [Coemansia sp. IMI 203386]